MINYRLEEGLYVMYDDEKDEDLWSGEEIGMSFSFENGDDMPVLHRHGDPEMVTELTALLMSSYLNNYLQTNDELYKKIAMSLVVIVTKPDIDDLNQCVQDAGYAGLFMKKFKEEMLL